MTTRPECKRMLLAILLLVVFVVLSTFVPTSVIHHSYVGDEKDPGVVAVRQRDLAVPQPRHLTGTLRTISKHIGGFDRTSGATIERVPVPFGAQNELIVNETYEIATPQYHLVKRADQVTITWQKAVCRGEQFISKLAGPGVPSSYSTLSDLVNNGWIYSEPSGSIPNDLVPAFKALSLSTTTPPNRNRLAEQSEQFSNQYRKYNSPTFGSYNNIFSAEGVIVAETNYSPADQVDGPRPVDMTTLPDLRAWSDVVWILWADTAGSKAGALKYIFRHKIITLNTRFIIEQATGAAASSYNDPYPGTKFQPYPNAINDQQRRQNEAFTALLGTPHGSGVAWILFNHRNALAGKAILSVNTFTLGVDYQMLWTIG